MSPRKEVLADGVEVWLGDSCRIMTTLGRFDAVVTDPPYGIGEAAGKNKSRTKLATAKDYGNQSWDDAPADSYLIDLIRLKSDHQIIFGGNYFDLPPSSCWLVWDKQNSGDFADCELAWTNLPKAVRRIYWRWNGMIRKGSDERVHPTQKPVGVMRWCLEQLPSDAKLICDPFMGSGTTGVACVREGKSFVGIEREPVYFEAAIKRIRDALQTPDMFVQAPAAATQEALL